MCREVVDPYLPCQLGKSVKRNKLGPHPGVLHQYCNPQVAFEFEPSGLKKAIVIIGGLTDGLLTVGFASPLTEAVKELGYSVFHIQLSSSYKGWGTESLDKDVDEINKLVKYLRRPVGGSRENVIILGRSTGSQDVIRYLLRHGENVDAGIMNAAVSDREGLSGHIEPRLLKKLNEGAIKLIEDGKSNQLLGNEYAEYVFNTPITAYRWWSLMVPGGDDDYFSSDLSDETIESTFGKIARPLLVLENENDEFVPKQINKQALLQRWHKLCNPKYCSKNSGILKGASHIVPEPEAQQRLTHSVVSFIREFSL